MHLKVFGRSWPAKRKRAKTHHPSHASLESIGRRGGSRHAKRRALIEQLEVRQLLARDVSGLIDADDAWSGTIRVTGDVTLASGAELTIQPGTVVKFSAGRSLNVDGVLNASGSAAAPIFFTSVQDDSVGEDLTEGVEGMPIAGLWESIYLNDGDSGSTLSHVHTRFGGDTDGNGAGGGRVASIHLGKDSVTLTDVSVADSYGPGIAVGGSPTLTRVDVQRATSAFTQSLSDDPTYANLSASGNTTNGVVLSGGTLTEDRTWDFAGLPVHLTSDLTIGQTVGNQPVTLSVTPGTVVKVGQARSFYAREGTLSAIGTAAEPIVFTAASDDSIAGDSNGDGDTTAAFRGYWESIYLEGNANILEHVEIRYAGDTDGNGVGGGQVPAVRIGAAGSEQTQLSDVRISQSYASGVAVIAGSPLLENVHVEDGLGTPFYFEIDTSPGASGLTARDNAAGDKITLQGGTLAENRSWDYGTLPLQLTGSLEVTSDGDGNPFTLSIAPGTIVKVAQAHYLWASTGTISAMGTPAEPIVFTAVTDDSVGGDSNGDGNATTPFHGYWESIYLQGPGNVLENVEVRFAGDTDGNGIGGGQVAAIQVYHDDNAAAAQTRLTNVRISESYSTGVAVLDASPTLENLHVEDGFGVPYYFELDTAPNASGLTAKGNASGDHILLQSGTLTEDRNWDYGTLPIHLTGDLTVASSGGQGATLSIAPGTVVKFPPARYLSASTGTISALGTPGEPIIFTGIVDDSVGGDSNGDGDATAPFRGFWESVYLEGPGTVLENVQVRYAGDTDGNGIGGGQVAAIRITQPLDDPETQARLTNVVVRDSYWQGVAVLDAQPTLQNVHVADSIGSPFYFELDSSPAVSDLTAAGNDAGDHILLQTGSLNEDRSWDYGDLPLHLTGDLTVANDGNGNPVTLSIAPGTVVKVPAARYISSTTGSIFAIGTANEPIVFTAIADDTAGGESNNDENATSPFPGYWEAVYLSGPDDELTHVTVRYAGDTDGNGIGGGNVHAIQVRSDQTLTAVNIESSYGGGLSIQEGAAATYIGGSIDSTTAAPQATPAIWVANGSLLASDLDIVGNHGAGDSGVLIANGESATVTNSSFLGNTLAVDHRGTDPANANFQGNWWGDAGGPHDPSDADGVVNNNPAGQGVTDFVDYGNFLTSPPARRVGAARGFVAAIGHTAGTDPSPLRGRWFDTRRIGKPRWFTCR